MSSGRRCAMPGAALLWAALAAGGSAQAAGEAPAQSTNAQAGAAASVNAQQAEQASLQAADRALQWPRNFDAPNGMHIQLYQPQIDTWNGDQIGGRMAVAAGPANGNPTYGVIQFSARADVNKPAGLVYLDRIHIQKIDVPTAPQDAAQLRSVLESHIPPNIATRRSSGSTAVAITRCPTASGSRPRRPLGRGAWPTTWRLRSIPSRYRRRSTT